MGSPEKTPSHWLRAGLLALAERFPRLVFNLYPPFLGTGIWVREISPDYRSIRVEMPLRFYNLNYFGTHFGGSLYAMCDPFLVFMTVKNLGPDYRVFDKGATIRFRRPGCGRVHVHFLLTDERLAALREAADRDGKADVPLTVDVVDSAGETVAQVEKLLQVRRRDYVEPRPPEAGPPGRCR
ncbi:MAG: YiiD C-terminal domain-containing protein [Deltaproteobacteria bacterium]|nr:YiiD C-terminal domain-containing protein [Deltaproteobacteria bacterium]